MGAGAKRAAVVALLTAVSGVAAPAAQAATASTTAKCANGSFSGWFTLHYAVGSANYVMKRGTGAAGPYIADSGAMRVDLLHQSTPGGGVTQIRRTVTGLASDEVAEIPFGNGKVSREGRTWIDVTFLAGKTPRCTATRELP